MIETQPENNKKIKNNQRGRDGFLLRTPERSRKKSGGLRRRSQFLQPGYCTRCEASALLSSSSSIASRRKIFMSIRLNRLM